MANEITSQNVAQAIVKLVAANALPALVSNLVMGNLVNRDFEMTLAQAGDTVNVPIAPAMSANNIAEAGTVTNQNPSLGNAQVVLNSHREATFTIPDVTKVLTVPDLLANYMRPATIAIAEAVETDLLSLYPIFTANTAVGAATTMDEARIDAAETALFKAKVPASEPKFLIVNSGAFGDLRQIPRFSEYQTVGNQQGAAIVSAGLPGAGPMGANGKIKDLLVFRSQLVQNASTTYYNLAFARDAFGLVVRRLPLPMAGTGAIGEYAEMGNFGVRIIMSYQPSTLAQQFTVDCLYGTAVLRNNFGVQVQSTGS